MEQLMAKKEGRGVQTENNRKMCKHIKDKDSYFFSDHSFCPISGQKECQKAMESWERIGVDRI